ncbi:hypothetical protein M942_24630 [Enterobacter ludwigii]|nr:hypothetical protein M942_24630 [Enterobacter ludwigii]KLP40170.1 hypothetical protein ABR36_09835 [Enterobacter ludwigii]
MWLYLITSITGQVTFISSGISQTTRCNIGELCITLQRGVIITLNGELTKLQDKNDSTEVIFFYDLPVEKPTGGAMSQSVY